jgi:hypothetical protein
MADFQDMVVGLRNGAVLAQLNEKLREVIAAVRETEKAGALLVTFRVSPGAKGKGGADVIVVDADMKTKVPQPDLGRTFFFTDEECNLLRNNPRQMMLGQQPLAADREEGVANNGE